MIDKTLNDIDELISLITKKEHNKSYFSKGNLFQFEFRFIMCMNIVRFELLATGEITDLTADAVCQLFAFGIFEFYFRDYPDIYRKCSELGNLLSGFNESLRRNDSLGVVGFENSSWDGYFKDRIAFFLKLESR